MTLGDLIRKARDCGNQFNTYDIPLYGENGFAIEDVDFNVTQNIDGNYFINMTVKER